VENPPALFSCRAGAAPTIPPVLKRRMRIAGGTRPGAMTYAELDSLGSSLGGV
jgi:hypothetical protein